jgi:hypothetical protein
LASPFLPLSLLLSKPFSNSRFDVSRLKVDLTPYTETHEFAFDEAFDQFSTTEEIYRRTARELVGGVFNGAKATCFAYGQTGSGKTFTMMGAGAGAGAGAGSASGIPRKNAGLYLLAARDIFSLLQHRDYAHLQVVTSFFEIYGGKIFDLLRSRKKLRCLEDQRNNRGVCIVGLSEWLADDPEDLMRMIDAGNALRSTGEEPHSPLRALSS